MNPKLLAAFNKHVAATFDKQLFLDDTVGELDGWEFDMETGILDFGGEHQWNAQVLGTESEESGTWLWAWANEGSQIPDEVLVAAKSLRKLGEDNGLDELCMARLPVDQYDGHFWSTIATGLCKADAYYRGSYEGGAVFLLIKDDRYYREIADPLGRLRIVFLQAISTYTIGNQKDALLGHVEFLGLSIEMQGEGVLIKDNNGNQLVAEFDDKSRLTSLAGTIGHPIQPERQEATCDAEGQASLQGNEDPATRTSDDATDLTFFGAWLRNCRIHFKEATISWGVASIIIGLITWPFTSLETAAIVTVVSFAILWFIGFIETGK